MCWWFRGGPVTRDRPESLDETVEYVRRTAPACRQVLSVCTGTFILAPAGLLEGRSCTTHYRRCHLLAAKYPGLKLHDARVVADGKLVSTAGVAVGIDGTLYVIARLLGQERARKAARQIEHRWDFAPVVVAGPPEAGRQEWVQGWA